MPETRRKFDSEFKEGAVRIVRETGKPIAQIARDLDINAGTLGNWVAKDRAEREGGAAADPFGTPVDDSVDPPRDSEAADVQKRFPHEALVLRRRAMREALDIDPTLRTVADLPPGWTARRNTVGGSWHRFPDQA